MFSIPNVTAFSPFSLLHKLLTLVQSSVSAGQALPKQILGSCLNSLIYEALKGTCDQKYFFHPLAISAWNSHDKKHPLKIFCSHTWFIWVNKALCWGERGRWENGKIWLEWFYLLNLSISWSKVASWQINILYKAAGEIRNWESCVASSCTLWAVWSQWALGRSLPKVDWGAKISNMHLDISQFCLRPD